MCVYFLVHSKIFVNIRQAHIFFWCLYHYKKYGILTIITSQGIQAKNYTVVVV